MSASSVTSHVPSSQQRHLSTSESRSTFITGVHHCKGMEVSGEVQEKDCGGYNWSRAYGDDPSSNLYKYAQLAFENSAGCLVACRGTLSNYQKVPVYDPVSQKKFHSTEQAFHFYKFKPDSDEREKILTTETPNEARKEAQKHYNSAKQRTPWFKNNLEVMVYLQLLKVLEPKTGMADLFGESKHGFIIEDTSSRRESPRPEKKWGDNGDGTGTNRLGLAQMKAREYVRGIKQPFTEEDVVSYYHDYVEGKLQDYYNCF